MDEHSSNNTPAPPSAGDQPVVSDVIDITIKTIDSKNFQFQVENTVQIKAFKDQIASQVGIEAPQQRMIFCGRVLADDKSFKDYKIDTGKVIHLVKRAPLAQQRTNTTNNTNANQQQNDSNRNNRGFYRSEDGSIVMGTISFESPSGFINNINQIVRRMLTTGLANSSTSSAGDVNSEASSGANQTLNLRNRINHIRRFLGYININFQILENPLQFPATIPNSSQSADEQVLVSEYAELFNAALAVSDRLRPHMNNYFQTLSSQPEESERRNIQNNHSILLRISHHLAHIMHLLSEFNVDLNNPNMPLVLNTLDHPAASPPSTETAAPTVTRNESSTSTTTSSSQSSMPRFSFSTSGTSILQSPVVYSVEVDTNINLPSNIAQALRSSLGNFTLPNDILGALSNSNLPTENNSTSSSTSNLTAAAGNNTAATTSAATTANVESASTESPSVNSNETNAASNTTESASGTGSTVQLPLTFDSYLNCNSIYTIPELRSATATHMEPNLAQIMSGLRSSMEQGNNPNNNLFGLLHELIHTIENSSNSQSSDQTELSDLLRFLLNQFNLSNEDISVEMNDSPSIGDYMRMFNLVSDSENQSIISELISVLFQNLSFDDLLSILNSDFHGFSRFREPFQNSIRNHLQHSGDWTMENIRREISSFIAANNNSLITIIANISPNPGVDSLQSFQNFATETLANFFNQIMQSNSDENFENDLLSALRYLVSSYIHFCRACFANPEEAINQLITNYFEQYGNYLNPRVRSYMSNVIIERIDSYSSGLENDQAIISQVREFIAHIEPAAPTVQMETAEPDGQSISNDSEVEFSDAISDFPSTSSAQRIPVESVEPNWQSIVPNEWVPIITEDINKQKDIDPTHQPPFSDAYLNGMPKRRRLEHKPDEEETKPEAKMGPKPH